MRILRTASLSLVFLSLMGMPAAEARQQVSIGGHEVRLVEVQDFTTPLAEVRVDGDAYRAGIGDSFGRGQDFEVRMIRPASGCVRLRFIDGDVRDIFRLCVR